jgi:hypothetical protein
MRAPIWSALLIITALALLVSFASQEKSSQNNQQAKFPTRRQLWESAYRQRGTQIVYPAAPQEIAAGYREYYESVRRDRDAEWFKRFVHSDADFPADSLGHKPLSLVGAIGSNRFLQQLLPQLPIKLLENGFRFRGQDYTAPDDILYLLNPNPQNPTQLLTVLTGNSDGAILDFLNKSARRLRQMSDYYVVQQGRIVRFGFFQDEGEKAWQPEAARDYDLHGHEKQSKLTLHFSFVTHGKNFSETEIAALAERNEENLFKLIRRLRVPKEKVDLLPRLAVHLWDSAEEKGMFTGNTDLRHLDAARHEAHLLWLPDFRGDDFFAEASWFVQQVLGECKSAALREGLAAALTDSWRGFGYSGWAARLVQTQNAPPLAELFEANIWEAESDVVRQPLLGSFVEYLLEKFGTEEFTKLYRNWPENGLPSNFPENETWQNLVAAWQEKMRATAAIALRHAQPPPIMANDFHRGFCYAHEGYQIYNGYLGHKSREALENLATLGVNAISVTPFGYLRQTSQPDFFRHSNGPSGENDESLIVARSFAKTQGMRVMLKPHIWVGRGWPGDINMSTPAAWKMFFDRYERWMRGYAMLAEMYDFDMLCVGVELVQASVGHAPEWRSMIKRLHAVYSGPMVYAANWGQEFENLLFGEALEAIGIDCYYPLSEKENPTDAELMAGAEQVVKKIHAVSKKFNKPVLLTEIGFCSMPQTWKSPHQDSRGAPVDLEAQRRCYEAIIQALKNSMQKDGDWLAGIYWWKWPTMLDDGGPQDNQFTPNGKPAAEVVARWYKQKAGESAMTGQ